MDGFKKFLNESVDASQEHDVLNMYRDNSRWHIRKISEITGLSIAGIYRVLEKYGIKPHRRQLDNNHEVVRSYHQSGIPARKISELTGYSRRQVYNIISKGHTFTG